MLKELAKEHKKWVNIVRSFGGGDYSEDIVQEMYLKIHDMELRPETMGAFVYFVLRNMTNDLHRKKAKIHKIDITDCLQLYTEETKGLEEYEEICQRITEEVEEWHWYDQMLWRLYTQGMSMRQLERETKISLSSIFHTLKTCKQRIRISVGEDYEDYLNEDYEKI